MTTLIIAGFRGRMGREAMQLIADNADFELIGAYDPRTTASTTDEAGAPLSVPVWHTFEAIQQTADVWLDLSVPAAVYDNVTFALTHQMTPIVGTTGLTDAQVSELQVLATANNIAGLIVPNFGLSAVLLMRFAEQAAQYFPDVEVIEMHHPNKEDAPSGTAKNTAQKIGAQRITAKTAVKTPDNAFRGSQIAEVPVHSVRLPGYVAHEMVLFGGPGEALTLRQDSFDRSSFMSGVALAIRKRERLSGLMVGLENVLD